MDTDGYSINYFEVARNQTSASNTTFCSLFDSVYFDNYPFIQSLQSNGTTNTTNSTRRVLDHDSYGIPYESGYISNPSCDGVNFVFNNYNVTYNLTGVYDSAGIMTGLQTGSDYPYYTAYPNETFNMTYDTTNTNYTSFTGYNGTVYSFYNYSVDPAEVYYMYYDVNGWPYYI